LKKNRFFDFNPKEIGLRVPEVYIYICISLEIHVYPTNGAILGRIPHRTVYCGWVVHHATRKYGHYGGIK
jgi:hypothetical protein